MILIGIYWDILSGKQTCLLEKDPGLVWCSPAMMALRFAPVMSVSFSQMIYPGCHLDIKWKIDQFWFSSKIGGWWLTLIDQFSSKIGAWCKMTPSERRSGNDPTEIFTKVLAAISTDKHHKWRCWNKLLSILEQSTCLALESVFPVLFSLATDHNT